MNEPRNDTKPHDTPRAPDSVDGSRLGTLLSAVRRRLWMVDGARAACWGLIGALLTVVVGMWFDLIWELPSSIRAATWGCAALSLLAVLASVLYRTWRAVERSRIARRIAAASDRGGELLNGFELTDDAFATNVAAASGSPLSAGLASLTVQRAEQLAAAIPAATVISPRPAIQAARWCGIAAASLVLAAILFPAMARTQWLRFSDPWSDTPPYSPFQFKVEPGDTEVLYGQGLDVRVEVTGPLTRDLQLLIRTGDKTEKVPMFPESGGAWRATLSRLTEDSRYLAQVDRARSPSYGIRVITTPKIEKVEFQITPPAYTNDPPIVGPLPQSGLVGLAGTKVRVIATSNRPLSGGEIRWQSDAETPSVVLRPATAGESQVVGEFTIERSGKFELRVTDAAGQTSQDSLVGSVTLRLDERPLVRILEPQPMSLATPDSVLPVVIDAEDDFGLAGLELYRSLNDSRPLAAALPPTQPPPRRVRDQSNLPLALYDLEPGDELKLFARVTDNDPAGPKGTESSVVVVRIISQAEFERMVRTREGLETLVSKYQQARRRLEKLAEELATLQKELEKAPADSPLAEKLRERIEKLAQEMTAEAEAVAQSAEHELPYDLDKNLKKQLTDVAKEMAEHADELKQLGKPAEKNQELSHQEVRRRLAKLAEKLAQDKKKFSDEATDPLDLFAKTYPLKECESRFAALLLWQKDLAERLATYKQAVREDNPVAKARMRDLQEEQRRAREELKELLDEIENHARGLPEEKQFDELRESALQFARDVRSSGATEEMESAETALTDFQGAAGHQHALEAAAILEKFVKKCQGVGDKAGQCMGFNPSLGQCLGDTVAQLLADAGLSSGPGQTGRGGYSMRSGNRGVGMYGALPSQGGAANAGRGFGASGNPSASRGAGGANAGDPSSLDAPWSRASSGAAGGAVPPQYRRRVNKYFERVADELEGR